MLPQFMSRGGNIEESKKRYLAGVPMARVGRPEEMANAALWLASDEASYVTGVAPLIDGGYSAK
jgi:NAD(P)-dependent dehydrogenase (short-subunit alcohol dehydrogenase family)